MIRRPHLPALLTTLALASACAFAQSASRGDEERSGSARLGGSADWEVFRSVGDSEGTRATFDAFRQRYSLDLDGAIWDSRFNRYSLGLDFFRADQKADGEKLDSSTLGYRVTTTFFPARPFPLLLFARRATTDSSGASLADSDRETASWGAEWNLATQGGRTFRAQFDETAYDLVSPVALEERRKAGGLQFRQQLQRSEISARYGLSDQRELVRDSRFKRQDLAVEERTRFDNGMTFLVNGSIGRSDAVFSTGERDELRADRVSSVFDVPVRKRAGFNLSYDFNRNDGRFVDSTSHTARGTARFAIAEHWESNAGVTLGSLASTVGGSEITQDLAGAGAGIRFDRDWSGFQLGASCGLGFTRTRFNDGQDRTATNGSVDLDARAPLGGTEQVFASASYRKDQNDTTGVGYSVDEARGTFGVEGGDGDSLRWRGSAYVHGNRYDTFQFGVQTSREIGVEGSLGGAGGGVSFGGATRKGISEFIPDPASGSPFVPGNDLVNRSRSAFAGGHYRFFRYLQVRAQVRMERREFTSIGSERVVSYHPEAEWNFSVWRISLMLSHYARNNGTSFSQDTLILKVSRLLF